VSSYLGEEPAPGTVGMHCVVVPSAEWDRDPRVHVVDWVNPDGAVARAGGWADEERRLRARRDAAMRRACGFD